MHPYFFPYYGYFNLIDLVDKFIILDDVQFNRRGWVHRNKLYDFNSQLSWLTLSITKKPRDTTLISDIEFNENVESHFKKQLNKFPKLANLEKVNKTIVDTMLNFEKPAIEYLIDNILNISNILKFKTTFIRSSEIKIDKEIDFQNNIINLVKKVDGNHYINLPGCKDLYCKKKFTKKNLSLSFLEQDERKFSILEALT